MVTQSNVSTTLRITPRSDTNELDCAFSYKDQMDGSNNSQPASVEKTVLLKLPNKGGKETYNELAKTSGWSQLQKMSLDEIILSKPTTQNSDVKMALVCGVLVHKLRPEKVQFLNYSDPKR